MTTMTDPRRSRWIPWTFVAGFALVVAVNGVLIVSAVRTFTGTTTVGAYDRGRGYGAVLAEAERQRALGWDASTSLRDGTVRVAVRLPDGSPIPADASVTGHLERPLERDVIALTFRRVGPGDFRAVTDAAPGAWDAVMTVSRGADRLEWRERLVFP